MIHEIAPTAEIYLTAELDRDGRTTRDGEVDAFGRLMSIEPDILIFHKVSLNGNSQAAFLQATEAKQVISVVSADETRRLPSLPGSGEYLMYIQPVSSDGTLNASRSPNPSAVGSIEGWPAHQPESKDRSVTYFISSEVKMAASLVALILGQDGTPPRKAVGGAIKSSAQPLKSNAGDDPSYPPVINVRRALQRLAP